MQAQLVSCDDEEEVFVVYSDEQLQVSEESDMCMEATGGRLTQAPCDEDAPG